MATSLTRVLLCIPVAGAFLVPVSPARAELVSYSAELNGVSEVPPSGSRATGTVKAAYDLESHRFVYTITFSGLSGTPTAAHFHGAAAPGTNGGPELPVPGPPTSPIRGEATLDSRQAADLSKGLWYLNIHSTAYPHGEIRGQLERAPAPTTHGEAGAR